MALAILLILLYHNKGALPEGLLKQAAGFCYVGVDIFFFASGVGCFFSYLRDRDPVSFLRRRGARILPAYLPFILVWIVLQAAGGGITLPAALANLFGVQGFLALTPAFNWYVSGMWLSYALTPWLAPLAEGCGRRAKAVAAVLALLLFSVAFWGDTQLIIMVTRLPVFFVGMLFAAESKRRERLTGAELALLLALVPVGAALVRVSPRFFPAQMWDCGLAWYPMLLMAPGLCVLVAVVSGWLSRLRAGRALNRALGALGGVTFEIYLAHFLALEKPPLLFLPLTALGTALLVAVSRLLEKRPIKQK